MTFGQKLKKARLEKCMTQKQLAEQLYVRHNSVSNWENDINKPDPSTIEHICGILDITPNYLLAITSEDFSPAEKLIIKKYRALDKHGKEMIDFTLQKEWERSTNVYSFPFVNAAHERTGIEVTEDMLMNDNDIMDSDSF